MYKLIAAFVAGLSITSCGHTPESTSSNQGPVESFHLTQVRLLDSPFKHAEQTNLDYIFAMDPDRLLAPYLREAGLEPKKQSYGNWENTGLDGHIGGHYLTSLALAYASTGNEEAMRRLNYMLDELERAQKAHGNGYLGGVPGSKGLWAEIRNGDIEADLFALNGKWVPWYNIHKIFAGLRDAYWYTGSDQAKRMLIELSSWTLDLTEDLSHEQIQTMLRTEHGGMNEIFADVAELTGDERYLKLAEAFSHEEILNPLLENEDHLNGLHANTQIPKVIGYQRVAEVGGDQNWSEAAQYFWNNVVFERSVSIGGNSVREHFHPPEDFEPMVTEREGPETCNTYNMLKLSKLLYGQSADTAYVDYYERALYNHILSSQHPDHGGLVYFTSMRPGHYRMYSQPEEAMWCCVGSGIENHFKYGELIYGHRNDELFVNLFIPSRLNWAGRGITLVQNTDFPDSDVTRFTIEQGGGDFSLKLRYPIWVKPGLLQVSVNGKQQEIEAAPGGYVTIERSWQQGDEVTLRLPMHSRLEQLPDQTEYYAVLHGPIVLAAKTPVFEDEQLSFLSDDSRMGHIAEGPVCPPEATPLMVGEPEEFLKNMTPVAGKSLTFVAPGQLDAPQPPVELIPFFRLHDARYTLYWPGSAQKAELMAVERERQALEAAIIDQVAPGEQQPESDHFFKGEKTEAGVHLGRHWRHAEGWFSYQLRDPNREAKILRITYFGGDVGREFKISLNGTQLADVELKAGKGADFYSVDYPVPEQLVQEAEDGTMRVRFSAEPGSIAGGIYGVQLLRKSP